MKNHLAILAITSAALFLTGCNPYDYKPDSRTDYDPNDPSCLRKGLINYMDVCWGMPEPAPTGIVPFEGSYSVTAYGMQQPNEYSIQSRGFSVKVDAKSPPDALLSVSFSANGWRYEDMRIHEGVFFGSIGGGIRGVTGNTVDCPSDGYAIIGSFVSSTSAQGHFNYIRYCQVVSEESYTAELVPKIGADSGVGI